MKIGEVAQRAGVRTSRLRFYESRGLLAAARGANGYREYTAKTVKIVGIIEKAQRLGFSLKEIGAFFALPPEERSHPETAISMLRGKLREIDAHMREVQKRRKELRELLREAEADAETRKPLKRR
jgi:MerR family transcriptional regulator, copper efflux regulator